MGQQSGPLHPSRGARGTPRALAKTDLALGEIDRVLAGGARFSCVLADAGYGVSAGFRQGLGNRGLIWAVGVPRIQNVYATTVELRWPRAGRASTRYRARTRSRPRPCWRMSLGGG